MAPAGIGKSWTLQAIGADAVAKGKTVIHYTLELNAQYVGLRYDSIVSVDNQLAIYNITKKKY